MDATAWVAVAGIAGTLLGTLLAPAIAEGMRRRSARDDRLLAARLEVYAGLLEAAAQISDNAKTWAFFPGAELKEPDPAFLDSVFARVRTLGSKGVREQALEFKRRIMAFYRELSPARIAQQQADRAGHADSAHAIQARMKLSGIAEEVNKDFEELERLIRRETAK